MSLLFDANSVELRDILSVASIWFKILPYDETISASYKFLVQKKNDSRVRFRPTCKSTY